jgi:hypothetical protein
MTDQSPNESVIESSVRTNIVAQLAEGAAPTCSASVQPPLE